MTKKVYIPKLENLSITAAVEGFRSNVYIEHAIEIIPKYKHVLFDELYIPHLALTPETVEEMLRMKLTTNSLVLGRNLSEQHRKLFFSLMKLEKLTVLAWNIEKKYERTVLVDDKRTIDIISFLKDFLCPESRLTLRELTIQGQNDITFLPEGVSELADLLPGITALDLSGCFIRDKDFHKLCERWPDLTQLHMGGTGIRSLDGIEKLEKLKTLSLENVHIDGENSIAALSTLHNLEFLNMSFYPSSDDSYQLSLRNQISIPNLKVLDMSLCQLNEAGAQKLFELNSNLERILNLKPFPYTGTPWSIFERERVNNESTVEKFCYLLKHYEKSPDGSKMVLISFNNLLEDGLMRTETNAREVLMCVEVLQNPMQNFGAKSAAIQCIHSISLFTDFESMLTYEEKDYIGKSLCNIIKMADWKSRRFGTDYLFHQIIRLSLSAKIFKHIKLGNIFGDVCTEFLTKEFFSPNTSLMCEYLVLHNQKVDILSYFETDSILKIKIELLKELQEEELSVRHCKPLLEFFAIIAKVSHSQLKVVDLNYDYVDIIFKKMERLHYDENIVQCGFTCLQLLYHQLEDLTRKKKQFKSNSHIIRTCVMSDNQINKTAAFKFIFEACKSNIEKELYEPLAQLEMDRIVTEVLDGDDLDMYQILQLVESLGGKKITSVGMIWLHQKLYKEVPLFMNGPAKVFRTLWILLSEVFTSISFPCTHSR